MTKRLIPTLLLAFSLVVPSTASVAVEQDNGGMLVKEGMEGYISLGGAGAVLSNKNSKFGEFSGIDDDTGFFQGEADLSYFRKSYFMNFQVEDLGLENREIFLETGKYGDYKFSASFEQLPQLLSTRSTTPLDGVGSTQLTLPAGFTRDNASTNLVNIGSFQKGVDLEIDGRETTTFGFSKTVGNNEFSLSYMRETKDGLRSLGMAFGTGGSSRGIVAPEVFDQTSNEVKATLAHNGETYQIRLEYFLSLFDNRIESLTIDNPFQEGAGIASLTPLSGQISRAPDNQSQRVSLSGGINLGETIRISGIAEYGRMEQDDNLFPFTSNFVSAIPLPRASGESLIETAHVRLNLSARPLSGLAVSAKYRHYQTFNDTPRTVFVPVTLDVTQRAVADTQAHWSVPYETIQDQFQLDASYRLIKATNLKLGYEVELLKRNFREVEDSVENTVKARLLSNYFSFANINLQGSVANRAADGNDLNGVFQERHTPDCISAGCGTMGHDSITLLRRYDVTDRERTKFGGSVSFFPSDAATVGVSYNYRSDDFLESGKGLTDDRSQDATIDLSYSRDGSSIFSFYYTYLNQDAKQKNRQFTSFGGTSTDPGNDYEVEHSDISHTVGIAAESKFLDDKLTLSADYSFTQSITDITFREGVNAAVSNPLNMPDLKTNRHTFEFKGIYRILKNIDLGLSYLYENYQSDDFETDGIDVATNEPTNVVLLSGSEFDYEGHLWMLFFTYKFGEDAK